MLISRTIVWVVDDEFGRIIQFGALRTRLLKHIPFYMKNLLLFLFFGLGEGEDQSVIRAKMMAFVGISISSKRRRAQVAASRTEGPMLDENARDARTFEGAAATLLLASAPLGGVPIMAKAAEKD